MEIKNAMGVVPLKLITSIPYRRYLKTAISKFMSSIPPNIKNTHMPRTVSISEEVGIFGVLNKVDLFDTVEI